jgi:excisionase family DNA binding protein
MNTQGVPTPSATNNRLLTPEEAAEFLQVSINTLSMWRSNQRYKLPYYKIGGSLVRYKLEDLIVFAHSNKENISTEQESVIQ